MGLRYCQPFLSVGDCLLAVEGDKLGDACGELSNDGVRQSGLLAPLGDICGGIWAARDDITDIRQGLIYR